MDGRAGGPLHAFLTVTSYRVAQGVTRPALRLFLFSVPLPDVRITAAADRLS